MRTVFIFTILLSFFGANAQHVAYYLPKKIIYVTVPFNIVEKRQFKIDRLTGLPDKNAVENITTVKINGDIKVESKLFPGAIKLLDLDPLGKGGKSFNFDITFDEKGNGMISTINSSQTPVTADIIKGTVGIVSSIIKFSSIIYGAVGGDQPEYKEITIEQNIEETRAIELTDSNPFSLTIKPSIKANSNIAGTIPFIEVNITKIAQGAKIDTNAFTSSKPGIQLYYRIPAEHNLQVIIKDNQLVKEQVVINERILVPQTGNEVKLLIPILKKKKTVGIEFDKETGNLSKYGLKKESQISENTGAIADGLSSVNTEVAGLKAALEAKKEENINKELKDEIERQKLENEQLSLIIEKQKLQEQIEAKKKEEAEAKKNEAKPKNAPSKE